MKRRLGGLVVYTMHLELSEGALEVWALRRGRKGRVECAEQVWQQGSWLRDPRRNQLVRERQPCLWQG